MKQILSMICAAVFMTALSSPALAISSEPSMTKAEFVEYCQSIQQKNGRSTTISDEEADQLLLQYASNTEKANQAEIEDQLNNAGIFIYSDGTKNLPTPLSEPSRVRLNNVVCSYNSSTGDWSLVVGGNWLDHTYIISDLGGWGSPGSTVAVGGLDAIGITIYNTSGTLPPLKASLGMAYDEKGNTKQISNPSTGNTGQGIAFMYQDTATIGANASFNYMGYSFSALMRFGSDFKNWNGFARGFYLHTWSSTTINSVGLGAYTAQISWSEAKNHFEVYSDSDTVF